MPISRLEFEAMQARVAPKLPKADVPADACMVEAELHQQIQKYCNSQWPPWKFLEFRMDKPAPVVGVPDFTIWASGGRVFNVECKTKTGKQDDPQIIWQHEIELLGHAYHVVRSMKEFLEIVKVPTDWAENKRHEQST
jgi:hypothetical protein